MTALQQVRSQEHKKGLAVAISDSHAGVKQFLVGQAPDEQLSHH